jgi:hypothetical protein
MAVIECSLANSSRKPGRELLVCIREIGRSPDPLRFYVFSMQRSRSLFLHAGSLTLLARKVEHRLHNGLYYSGPTLCQLAAPQGELREA